MSWLVSRFRSTVRFAATARRLPRRRPGLPGNGACPRPRALAGQRQWLRLVYGGGSLKCWTSGDGIHWGLAVDPLRQLDRGYSTAGVYCLPGNGLRSIRLRRLEARPLAMIESLAPAAL